MGCGYRCVISSLPKTNTSPSEEAITLIIMTSSSAAARRVELTPGSAPKDPETCKLIVDLPFQLASIAEAEVDIGKTKVLVRATASGQEAKVELHPEDPEIEVDLAAAKFSKKKGQLTISWPRQPTLKQKEVVEPKEFVEEMAREEAPGTGAAPEEEVSAEDAFEHVEPGPGSSVGGGGLAKEPVSALTVVPQVSGQAATAPDQKPEATGECGMETGEEEDDDDDDDLPPALAKKEDRPFPPAPEPEKKPWVIDPEEARKVAAEARKEATSLAAEGWGGTAPGDGLEVETNPAAELMLRKAAEGKQKKSKEVEAERKKSATNFSGGLKKGFFSGDKGSEKKKAGSTGGGSGYPAAAGAPKKKEPEVPYLVGNNIGSKREQLLKGLELPEVQANMQDHCEKLKTDTSWVTPQLMQALAQKPHLMALMQNPKVQEAMQMMQKNPEEAKKKFDGDKDVELFFKEFSGLMATHFDLLSKEEPKKKPEQEKESKSSSSMASTPGQEIALKMLGEGKNGKKKASSGSSFSTSSSSSEVQNYLPSAVTGSPPVGYGGGTPFASPESGAVPIEDPEVARALQNPEVRQLIDELRAGVPLEPREIFRRNPRLFADIQVLLKNGLLNIQS